MGNDKNKKKKNKKKKRKKNVVHIRDDDGLL